MNYVLLEHKVVAKQLVTIERNLRKKSNSTLASEKNFIQSSDAAIVKLQ